ncbi:MAG: NADP-specific glutamate dehydrogenase [Oscillospiraceae bacterium]|nr:NADP-specific glutamate dehydrogenase [Oscillospiraceae bacterium]
MNNKYLASVYEAVQKRNPGEPEFHAAVRELFETVQPLIEADDRYERYAILERMTEPERMITFRVPWVTDDGKVMVNRGYRVQFNSAIGPYKGGIRFHPSVNASIIKFLGFEQTFKNCLTSLPMGGGKGGADFDPKGRSEMEVMRFCQSFMTELYRHIGADTDVPAGDIGVGGREVGFMFGQYRRITNEFTGTLTGKGIPFGGSLGRTQATGFGLCYYANEMLAAMRGDSLEGKRVAISGSGNVAIYAAQKATELGATVVTVSDSDGYVYDKDGIDLDLLKQIKEVQRGRVRDYAAQKAGAQYFEGCSGVWSVPCDVAMPCATQNELSLASAKELVKNGVIADCEGANMPTEYDAVQYLLANKVLFSPAKASNAGGVAVSGLEMSQNATHISWSFEEVDSRLKGIMASIFKQCYDASKEYADGFNLLAGANIASFKRVADAMIGQGIAY